MSVGRLPFFAMWRNPSGPDNEMALSIDITPPGKQNWPRRINEFLEDGADLAQGARISYRAAFVLANRHFGEVRARHDAPDISGIKSGRLSEWVIRNGYRDASVVGRRTFIGHPQ